jgi:hypothetical protein
MDNKSEIVKTFEASGMTPKFHVMIVFANGKRKQQDDSTSESQAKSATRTMLASGSAGRAGLSTSRITSGVFADNFSELEHKYDNQLMGTTTAEDVYQWLRMSGMDSIQGIPKRAYSTDHLEVPDLLTTR